MTPDNMPRPVAAEHRDLRNDLAKARDEWMDTPEGKRATDPDGISLPPRNRHYLRNRIELAFIAGWNAKESALAGKG